MWHFWAAELKGRSITDFVVNAAHDAAQRVIEENGIIRLSAADQVGFAKALRNPAKPNAALKRALLKHSNNVDMKRKGFSPKR